jgi:carbon-monoxide dehydrogenase medium subunit
MKPPPFEYQAPDSLEAALEILAEHGDEAKVLAGGQSLIPAMNFRVAQPTLLVDLNRLAGLDYVRRADGGGLLVGAMTRQRRLELDGVIAESAPLLHEAMPHVAHPQIRNRGTLGGSLVHADPAAELPVVALAAGATMRVRSTGGQRDVPAGEFFQGMFVTALQPEEILVEVALPPMPPRSGWSFKEVSRRRGDYAMMGVGVLLALDKKGVCQQASLVYLNAGDGPVAAPQAAEALRGEKRTPEAIEAAAMAAGDEIDPFGNLHASVEYQRHLARVLTRQALETAFDRAAASLKNGG